MAELYQRVFCSKDPGRKRIGFAKVLAHVEVLNLDEACCIIFAQERGCTDRRLSRPEHSVAPHNLDVECKGGSEEESQFSIRVFPLASLTLYAARQRFQTVRRASEQSFFFQDYAKQARRLADGLICLEDQIRQYGKGLFLLGGGLDLQPSLPVCRAVMKALHQPFQSPGLQCEVREGLRAYRQGLMKACEGCQNT